MNTTTVSLLSCAFAGALTCHAAPVTGWVSIFDPQGNSPRFTAGTEATDSPVTTDADQDSIAANFPAVTLADEEFIILTGTISIDVNMAGGQFRVGLFDGPAAEQDVGNPYLGFYTEGPTTAATTLKWGDGMNASHAFGGGVSIVPGFLPGEAGTVVSAGTPIDFSLTIIRDGANLDIESSYSTAAGYSRSARTEGVDVLAIKADYNYTFNTAAFLFGGSMDGSQATFSNIDVTIGTLDSDRDGMLDAWEIINGLIVGTNDADLDTEPDGLTNIQEYQGKDGTPFTGDETDPQVADTDGDGLSDGDEILTHLTNPLSKDTDGDFFEDGYELDNSTDPTLATSYPVPANGLFIDFSNNGTVNQDGPRHDVDYAAFGADHEIDSSNAEAGQLVVDRSESYPVPAFTGSPMVTLSVAYPDAIDPRVKQMVGRTDALAGGGFATTYEGERRDLMRDWIGIDPRAANGGNGIGVDTSMTFTLSGLPAGIYQYRGYHHEVANIQGPFDLSVNADGATNISIGTFRMTHGNDNGLSPNSNPGTGTQPSELPSTIEFLFTADGVNDVVITYAAQERGSFQNSLVGVNAIEVTTAFDTDGDGIPDAADLRPSDDDTGLSSDADSLTDLQEFHLGTKLDNPDTDNDGFNDDAETNTGLWVSLTDTGTSPWVADWDGDGLLDGIETNDLDFSNWPTASGTDPFIADTDFDGSDDGDEANGGFDPTDANSFPPPPPFQTRVIAVDLIGKTITLEWDSVEGAAYDIYGSNDLLGDPQTTWFEETFNLPSGGTTTQITLDLPDPVPTRRFFKVFQFGP